MRAAGRRGAGPCPCGPAGRCAGQGLEEAAGGAGGGREGRQLPSGPCHSAARTVGVQLRASWSPSPAYRGTERVLEPRPSFLGSCGRPGAPARLTRGPRGSWSPGPASWAAAGVPESGPSCLLAPLERADARGWVAVGLSCPSAHLLTCYSVKFEYLSVKNESQRQVFLVPFGCVTGDLY